MSFFNTSICHDARKLLPMLPGVRFLPRRLPQNCRAGAHRYGPGNTVGPGILRRVCQECTAVSIDLTAEETEVSAGLFTDRPETVSAGR